MTTTAPSRTVPRDLTLEWHIQQNRAQRLASCGRFEEARDCAEQALQLAAEIDSSASNYRYPASLHLVLVCQSLVDRDFAGVEVLIRGTLATYEACDHHDRGNAAVMRGNLAYVLSRIGRDAEAETTYLRALASAARYLRRYPKVFATMLGNASNFYRRLGRTAVADALGLHAANLRTDRAE